MSENTPDFYLSYDAYKNYQTPQLKAKHIRQFDREFWHLSGCHADLTVLELGAGVGQFLAYLKAKGVTEFRGVDQDPALSGYVPAGVRDKFTVAGIFEYLADNAGAKFDRVALFDVLEHFSAEDGARLLMAIRPLLAPSGNLVIRVPNVGSPWGVGLQFGDLTHRTPYTPMSLRQLAGATGYNCVKCIGQKTGRARRRVTEAAINWVLSKSLTSPPQFWSANFIALLEPDD